MGSYDEAAESCARHLARMFGSEAEAARALQEDPVTMVGIALDAHMKAMRKMAVQAHMNQSAFARQVLYVARSPGVTMEREA